MGIEKYGERMKQETMYEFQQGNDVGCMLEQSETNSRVNEAMARWCFLGYATLNNWRGSYRSMFSELLTTIQRLNLNMEGYARVQAIDMCAAHSITEQALMQKKEEPGILGMFGGKK